MSFDTEFDYTDAIAFVDSRISKENDRISSYDAEIASLSGLTNDLAVNRTNMLNRLKTQANTRISEWNDLKTKMQAIPSIDAGNKDAIYDMWVLADAMGESKDKYMAKIMSKPTELFDYANSFINDGDLSAEQKNTLTSLACQEVIPGSDALRLTGRFSPN